MLFPPNSPTRMNENDLHIGLGLKNRDKFAIVSLYDEYGDVLFGVVQEIVRDEFVAKDVVQETFVKAWQKGSSYDPEKSRLFSWLFKIARNTAIDKLRQVNRRIEVYSSVVPPGESESKALDNSIDVEILLNSLEPKYKNVLEMTYIYGFTQQEASQKLQIPLGTVKSRVKIALSKLRENLNMIEAVAILHVFTFII